MNGYVICDRTSGLPSYYTLTVAVNFAAAHGWTPDANQALGFVHEGDATAFLNKYLPHAAPYATITPHRWENHE